MHIFIDESGSFVHRGSETHSYSCAGALTIPGRHLDFTIQSYERMKNEWGYTGAEPKGRELTEHQVSDVVALLLRGKARFHVCATDMACNTAGAITARKRIQADLLTANITAEHQPGLVGQLQDLQNKMNALPDQLFVQLMVMTELVSSQLSDTVVFFALTDPPELGEFNWVIDRKDERTTAYEHLWRTLLAGFVQDRQFSDRLEDRIICVAEGDYSSFDRYLERIDEWPHHLPPAPECPRDGESISVIDVGRILRESFYYTDSSASSGLQLADIVTNAFRRAISGRLDHRGWQDIGKMMFRRGNRAVRVVHFADEQAARIPLVEEPARSVVIEMTRKAGTPYDG